jgi:carboxyl-terminal processing protease
MQRNRNEFRLFLVAVLVLGLFIGHGLSGYVVAQSGSTYEKLEVFSDALSIVQSEYVEKVAPDKLIYGALRGMLNQLDAHSQFMPPETYGQLRVETEGHFGGLGIVISLDEDKILTVISPIDDTPAAKAGVMAGDKIVKIDGEDSFGLVLEEAVKKLRGPKGSKVTIGVIRLHEEEDGLTTERLEFTLTRAEIQIPSVKSEMLEDGIAYVRLLEFSERTGADLDAALKELKEEGLRSIILDIRNNPGGLLSVAAEVSDVFLEKGRLIVYTESRDSTQDMRFNSKRKPTIGADVPMVVLVNGGSASASEIVAGAMMDWGRAVIMGEKTFGKGSVQSIIPMSDGSALRLTTARYLTPNGHSINGVGIEPDIEIKISRKEAAHLMAQRGTSGFDVPDQDKDAGDGDAPSDAKDAEAKDKKIDDPQLQRAIQLLQGYDIFKSLEQNVDVAKAAVEKVAPSETGEEEAEPVAVESEDTTPADGEETSPEATHGE